MDGTLSHGRCREAGLRAALVCTAIAAGWLIACDGEAPEMPAEASAAAEPFAWPAGDQPRARIQVKDRGTIEIELYPSVAPRTVENFIGLARSGFYDGTTFHRVVPGFMIQGGDPLSKDGDPANDGQGAAPDKIPDEMNGAAHVRGVVSMAHMGRPNSASSQFFIMQGDRPDLDGLYTAFGRVVTGMEVVDAIASVETDLHGRWGAAERPLEDVVIERVTILDARAADAAARPGGPGPA